MNLTFHHIGIACEDLEKSRAEYELFGYKVEGTLFHDPLQMVNGLFMTLGETRVELLQPTDDCSPVRSFLKRRVRIYHQCYCCADLDGAVNELAGRGAVMASPPKPAVAFGSRRVAFMMTVEGTLVELLESTDKECCDVSSRDVL